MGRKIGIDLGTSTSEIAYLDGIDAKLIKNLQEGNSVVIPSVVLLDGNSFKVGKNAKKKAFIKSRFISENIKKHMGKSEFIKLGSENFKPEYISAVIAKRLKGIAEFNLNEKVDEAVVAVPAMFNSLQRKATRDALLIAGFNIVSIINEPTAAAIAYGVSSGKNENVLVYDLGGGTFDVSILEIKDSNYKVISNGGKYDLGGDSINKLLFDTIITLFESSTGKKIDLNNKRLITEINIVIEEAKKDLSFEKTTSIVVPNITFDENNNPLDLNLDLSRDDFEYLVDDMINSTLSIVNETLKSANLSSENIDKVILVGGSTRIPLIRKKLGTLFQGKIVNGINPEELVAKGAILSTIADNKEVNIVNEVTSNNIGVEIMNGVFDKIIEKGSKLPVSISKKYKTVESNQEVAQIKIFEGENEEVKGNKFISEFDLENIPKDDKGAQGIEIDISYNLDGTLEVFSTVLSNSKNIRKLIPVKGLKEDEINTLRNKLKSIDIFNEDSEIFEFDDIENSNEDESEIKAREEEEELRVQEEMRRLEEEEIYRIEEENERLEAEKREIERLEKERINLQKLRLENKKREKIKKEQLEAKKNEEERVKRLQDAKLEREKMEELGRNRRAKLEIEEQERRIEKERHDKQSNLKKVKVVEAEPMKLNIRNIIDKDKEEKKEIIIEETKNIETADSSDLIEEYDPSKDGEIYDDLARLMQYYKDVSSKLDPDVRTSANELIGDLVGLIKKDKFMEARKKENEIISLIYIG